MNPVSPDFWCLFFILVLAVFNSSKIQAQSIAFNNTVPTGLTVCGSGETFTIAFTNQSGTAITNVSLSLNFPTGVQYVPTSLSETSTFNVAEQDISNLSAVIFSMNNIPDLATVSFDINASATFDAYTAQLAGNVFQNTVTIDHSTESTSEETDVYNILYPALSVTNVTPMSANVFVGETFTRAVTIVNGGYGSLSTFELEEIDNSNLELIGVDYGALDNNTKIVTFSAADFTAFGNNDIYFDQNESITITQTLTALGCNSTQSEITAYWGCDGERSESNTKFPFTTINLFAPSLGITAQPTFNTCVDGSPDLQQLSITNNGSGPANELEIIISPIENYSVTEIDKTSIAYTLNGSTNSLTATTTSEAYNHTCFSANPIDGFTVTLPTVQPGETLLLNWNNITCAAQSCGSVHYVGWDYDANYTDMCNSKTYESDGKGQSEYKKGFSTFYESPSDLVDGEVGNYNFIISSATFKLPAGTDPYFEVEFNIPDGLVWNGGADDLSFVSNVTEWPASQINYDANTKVLKAKYDMPLPNSFYLNHSTFNLDLTADCSAGVSWTTVGMQLFYILDDNCASPYRIPMTCYENPMTQIHCPGPCDHGMSFHNFEVARTSFGGADNNLDGLPDSGGSLDFTKVKTNRVMMNDTFETTFTGFVNASATFPSFAYGYARSEIPYGASIAILSARIEVYDASSDATYTCNQVPYTTQLNGDIKTVDFDFSPATLAALGCSDFSGFVFEQSDQVVLIPSYKLIENIGGHAEQIMIQNDFYLSDAANGTAYQCNDWNGNFTVIGYYHRVNRAEQYNVHTCTKTLTQTYKLSVGDCCTNYAGGNIFPYEYRNWSHLKDLRVEIPEGYSFVSGSMSQWRTAATNSSIKETSNISPSAIVQNSLLFDMEEYLVSNGGSINLSDDGYNGNISIELQPNCNVNQSANNPVVWYCAFQESDFINGAVTQEYTSAPDYIKYYRSNLEISTTLPTQEGIAETVSWNVNIKSKNANASNAWFYLENLAANINILEVTDLSDNSILTPVNELYQMGEMNWNEIRNYQITASYNSCNLSELKVISGHDCNGYPSSYSAYDCDSESYSLYIAPQPSELQVKFNSYINAQDECDNVIGIELEMLSSKLAAVSDLLVDVYVPSGQTITIISGSMEVLYPASGNYTGLPDPSLLNEKYTITGMDMDAIIGNDGLVGVTDLSGNIVKLRFDILLGNNFKPGDLLDIDISGNRPCGNSLPTLAMTFDPNASFGNLTGIGLDDVSNNWGSAWGDYDNDGFVDLFVTNYETNAPNLLYHNNGDGSFTKVSTGAITTDLASSLAASWGDYDNDGDLDLYVANNIGYQNFLYRNNGNGSFTKIANDPVVNDLGYAHGVSWVDYDRDGFLDLFVADYFSTKFNQLYHNNGDGTFTKETNSAPVLEAGFSVSGIWGDYNNDGYPDLFITNTENSNNSLYENKGDGQFLKINTGAIVTDGGSSVGASWGDYNNDGHLDLFVANAGDQDNFLYTNNGDGSFTRETSGVIVNDGGHSHGSAWADYDNDGDLDLFVSNDQGQDNFLYSNNGDGTFSKTINQITQDSGDSFGAGWADIDNDGDVDLFIANHNSNENFVYENSRGKCQSKFCVILEGTNSNRSAIGTKVHVKSTIYGTSVWQMRELSGQTGGGIGGQNELKTIFGLGNATAIDSVIIEWSSGYQQVLVNPALDDCMTITEENGSEICGIAYYDENGNCTQDVDEPGLSNIKLIVQPGNRMVMTNELGAYSVLVEPGSYTISEDASGTNWMPTCTLEKSVVVEGIGNSYCGNNFSNDASCTLPDLKVELSTTAHRVGFENLIALTYKNEGGAVATNVALTVMFGDDVIPLETSIPWDLAAGTDRRWNLGDVGIGESLTIYIKDSISTNAVIGENIELGATIYGNEEDCLGGDNVFQSSQLAVGAIDPNDIQVSPEGFVDTGEELIYKIRFQNVGNTTVSTVRIEDQLPEGLDLNTFQQGVSSHPYSLEIRDRQLIWTFVNINMPDSLTNEVESHGFIIFKIKVNSEIENGTRLENSAAIFFDNIAPVITNVVLNTVGAPTGTINKEGSLLIMPNPMKGTSVIEIIPFGNDQIDIQSFTLVDMLGRKLYEQSSVGSNRVQLKKGILLPGCYLIRVLGVDGDDYVGRILVE